jgi:hypothetical protein
VLLLGEFTDREILISNHQPDLALAGVAAHRSAEVRNVGQVSGILNIAGRRVAMDNDGSSLTSAPFRSSSRQMPFAFG